MNDHANHEYDDECPGCQPCLADAKTGEALPDNHPYIIKIRKAFKEKTTLTERRAWHRVIMQNSQNANDIEIAQKVTKTITDSLNDEDWEEDEKFI